MMEFRFNLKFNIYFFTCDFKKKTICGNEHNIYWFHDEETESLSRRTVPRALIKSTFVLRTMDFNASTKFSACAC
jgi:hypothetical protein